MLSGELKPHPGERAGRGYLSKRNAGSFCFMSPSFNRRLSRPLRMSASPVPGAGDPTQARNPESGAVDSTAPT